MSVAGEHATTTKEATSAKLALQVRKDAAEAQLRAIKLELQTFHSSPAESTGTPVGEVMPDSLPQTRRRSSSFGDAIDAVVSVFKSPPPFALKTNVFDTSMVRGRNLSK
jgi:hypothetical protein